MRPRYHKVPVCEVSLMYVFTAQAKHAHVVRLLLESL